MDNDSANAPQGAAGGRERRLFWITLAVLGGLLGACCIPLFGGFVMYFLIIAFLLWFYIGLAAACVAATAAFRSARKKGVALLAAALSAFRWSVIVGGAVGVVLLVLIPVFGYGELLGGYWLQAKLWLNVPEVRQWADDQCRRHATERVVDVPWNEWSPSMKRTFPWGGRVHVNVDERQVCHDDGGGFVGSWGIIVAPPGTADPGSPGGYIKIEDGVWAIKYQQ